MPADTFQSWTTSGQSAGMESRHGFLWQAIKLRAGFSRTSRVLDLGCGEGWASRLASEIACEAAVVGFDASSAMIEIAASKNGGARRVIFLRGQAENLPFAAGQFSHAFSIEALYYTRDLKQVAVELFRVMEPGGKFITAINYYLDNLYTSRWAFELQMPIYNRSADEHQRIFHEAGFVRTSVDRVYDAAPLPDRYEGRWFESLEERIAFQKEGALLLYAEK